MIAVDERTESNFDPEEYQFLTKMEVRPTSNSKIRINFCNDTEKRLRKINSDRINTD